LEKYLDKTAEKNLLPLQPGDVPDTYADVTDLVIDVNYKPSTSVDEGIKNFARWYKDYYKVS
jgi:UDP-glucuronate 4-epimerase